MIIALAALIVICALLITLWIGEKQLPPAESETPIRPLEEAKARIYEGLRDLQFEYRVGKLSDEDYQAAKLELQKELARVLQQMDEAAPAGKPPAASKQVKVEKRAGLVCPHCGAKFPSKLKFCGECGKSMEAEA